MLEKKRNKNSMIWGFSPLSSCDNVLFKIVITGQSFLVMQGLSMATRKKIILNGCYPGFSL